MVLVLVVAAAVVQLVAGGAGSAVARRRLRLPMIPRTNTCIINQEIGWSGRPTKCDSDSPEGICCGWYVGQSRHLPD